MTKQKIKIGRNDPCPCESGKKYKKCCWGRTERAPILPPNLDRIRANELLRQKQQGLGKPIMSSDFKGSKILVAGNRLHISRDSKTFIDALAQVMANCFGKEWFDKELKKGEVNQHILAQWYVNICHLQKENIKEQGIPSSMVESGVVTCYFGVAYSLYLLEHNVELQRVFINRLKDMQLFHGAYYELIVANCLIRAGFQLELENEADSSQKHCEFSAVSKFTGKKYWVEAKARGVVGVLGKTEIDGTNSKDPTSSLSRHVREAMLKTTERDRLIFIDVNTEVVPGETSPSWLRKMYARLEAKERDLKEGERAFIYVTNFAFHRHLDRDSNKCMGIAPYGLGIPDFPLKNGLRYPEIYRIIKKHIDAYDIVDSLRSYPNIPSTLDGSLPSDTFGAGEKWFKIGDELIFDETGFKSKITDAFVLVGESAIYLTLDNGNLIKRPLSEEQLLEYHRYGGLCFGKVNLNKPTNDPYEAFENLVKIHLGYSPESIDKKIREFSDYESLKKLDFESIVLIYCERLIFNAGLA